MFQGPKNWLYRHKLKLFLQKQNKCPLKEMEIGGKICWFTPTQCPQIQTGAVLRFLWEGNGIGGTEVKKAIGS